MPREIKVKTLTKYFEPSCDGLKPFEVRSNERDYRVGDILIQREWDPVGGFSGYETRGVITYILDDPEYCPEGMVILGLRKTQPDASKQALRMQARSERQQKRGLLSHNHMMRQEIERLRAGLEQIAAPSDKPTCALALERQRIAQETLDHGKPSGI